ncbi:hypothetical protein NQ317_011872 [Molorchus minor]|uniref:mitogen-activated protein kinase kinase n=1 Tax=Molorchus minor TaxID=1323400 RepID=A0ABQ9JW66_9CUCU|nr:hypothetical protein NQ317_011872 [Molorchus minor]
MKISGDLKIDGVLYKTNIREMEDLEELGNGTCGHVVKMRHKPSGHIIAVKQMRCSGNPDENKRIIMDIEVVLKSHDCKYIVQCLGCFITESEVWICMELMDTCFDKLLKRFKQPVPEEVLGKVTVATVEALSYLKDKHGVIHRDVKPSNILLDSKGNVKLCDFGISGRLVDSMAKTRSAGCAAYMAPERIEPDPQNPDYDVATTYATGVFPYQDCKTDFEVLTKSDRTGAPLLPQDIDFSTEFRDFYETANNVNVGEWYVALTRADDVASKAAPRTRRPIRSDSFSPRTSGTHNPPQIKTSPTAGPMPPLKTSNASPQRQAPFSNQKTERRISRLSSFQSNNQRESQDPTTHQRTDTYHQSASPNSRSYSPFQAYQNHVASLKEQTLSQDSPLYSPLPHRRLMESPVGTPYQHRRVASESRWRSPSASPLPLRSQFQTEDQQYNSGNTSPIILQRFYHQQKQQMAKEAEESAVTEAGDHRDIKVPEPPPRINRRASGDSQSPLALRRTFLETHTPNSPALSRRVGRVCYNYEFGPGHITPPQFSRVLNTMVCFTYTAYPTPRRLSESTSVPGSPQHLRARVSLHPRTSTEVLPGQRYIITLVFLA